MGCVCLDYLWVLSHSPKQSMSMTSQVCPLLKLCSNTCTVEASCPHSMRLPWDFHEASKLFQAYKVQSWCSEKNMLHVCADWVHSMATVAWVYMSFILKILFFFKSHKPAKDNSQWLPNSQSVCVRNPCPFMTCHLGRLKCKEEVNHGHIESILTSDGTR